MFNISAYYRRWLETVNELRQQDSVCYFETLDKYWQLVATNILQLGPQLCTAFPNFHFAFLTAYRVFLPPH